MTQNKNNFTIQMREEDGEHRYFFYDNSKFIGSCLIDEDYLDTIEVNKKYRGKGYGRQILEYCINTLGVNSLNVKKDNEVAVKLYESLGFKVDEEFNYNDETIYYMTLDESINYNSIIDSAINGINKELDKLGFELEYIDDYDFEDADTEDWVGVFCRELQDSSDVFPVSINIKLLNEAIKNNEIDKEDLGYHIKKTLWHEAGHGIFRYCYDLIDALNIDSDIFDFDEERVVEEFAEYEMSENTYSKLLDIYDELSNINESLWSNKHYEGTRWDGSHYEYDQELYTPEKDSKYQRLCKKPINTLTLDEIKYIYAVHWAIYMHSVREYKDIDDAIKAVELNHTNEEFEECYKFLSSLHFPLTVYRGIRVGEFNSSELNSNTKELIVSGKQRSNSWTPNINIYKNEKSRFRNLTDIVCAEIDSNIIDVGHTIGNFMSYSTGIDVLGRNISKGDVFGEYEITLKKNFKQSDLHNLRFINKEEITEYLESKSLDEELLDEVDSEGNSLTKEQEEYFKDSVVRDDNGNLLVCYHGTSNPGFKEFNPKDSKSQFGDYKFNDYNVNYFTTNRRAAASYTEMGYESDGNVYACYINIENPFVVDNKSISDIKSSFNIKDDRLRDKQVKLFDTIFNKWKDKIVYYTDEEFKELNRDLAKLNLSLVPADIYENDVEDEDVEYFDLVTLGNNSMLGASHTIEYQYTTDELFSDDMYEQLREEIIGEDVDDYYLTTDDVVRYVIAMNEDGENFDGIIIDDILDSKDAFVGNGTDVITLKSSNQIKLIDNTNPTSSNRIDEAGYNGYSMSNNAVDAYESGQKPLSKWTKESILNSIEEVDSSKVDMFRKLNLDELKNFLTYSSWHHTSYYYNKTDFYELDVDKVNNTTIEDINNIINNRTKKQVKQLSNTKKGKINYIEWSGTRNHPKANQRELDNVNIEEKGSYYIVTDDEGKQLLKKMIGSNGTRVKYYESASFINEQVNSSKTYYHGSTQKFDKFNQPINWFSDSLSYAEDYATYVNSKDIGYIYTCNLNCKNTFDCGDTDFKVFGPMFIVREDDYTSQFKSLKDNLRLTDEEVKELINNVCKEQHDNSQEYKYRLKIHIVTRTKAFRDLVMSKGYDSIRTLEEDSECIGVFNGDDVTVKSIDEMSVIH